MDNFIVIVFIYIKGRKESVIVMIKPTHSKVWKTEESNYVKCRNIRTWVRNIEVENKGLLLYFPPERSCTRILA